MFFLDGKSFMNSKKILIIIPCYNEQGSIENLLNEIKTQSEDYNVVVIDDGSKDSTFDIAFNLAPTVRLLKNLGIGGAVQTGIRYAAQNGYEFCVQIDGDGQHPPAEIKKLKASYDVRPASITIGSRYLVKDNFHSTRARRAGSKAISWTLRKLFNGQTITDPTSGMRLMDKNAIQLFSKSYPHDFPEPISLAMALKAGLIVHETGVSMRSRNDGQSSISGFKPLAYMLRVLGYLILVKVSRSRKS
ncbi:MAG: glycosyltransferase family 2 protein [Bdellovibrionaceae bacterium]|nr:glycosyltransferase family 2 protein [Pseudobdellovibrionaceae bacterium]